MKLKSLLAAAAAGVALVSPRVSQAADGVYDDGTVKWSFDTYYDNDVEYATITHVERGDGKDIEGALVFPGQVVLTATNELGYTKYDSESGKYNWVSTRERKITTREIPVQTISLDGFYQQKPTITSVAFPEGVKSVYDVDGNCLTNVEAVTIPTTLKSISDSFEGCAKLANVSIPADAEVDASFIGTAWAKAMGDFFIVNRKLICYQGKCENGTVVVPEGVVVIGHEAFDHTMSPEWPTAATTNLVSVVLPKTLEEIENYAFYKCKKLSSVEMPDCVFSIDYGAFYDCSSLASLKFPANLTYLGRSAFFGTPMTSIVIPDNMKDLDKVCEGMTNLTSVTLPSKAEYLCYTFDGCEKLTSVVIPDSVKTISSGTFSGCKALESVTGGAGLTCVANWAFDDDVPFYKNAADGFRTLGPVAYGFKGECPENVTVPAGVKHVMSSVLISKPALKTLTLSDGVESVASSAFGNNWQLETINLGNTVTNLGNMAFGYCSNLKTVTGGAALQHGYDAFLDMPSIPPYSPYYSKVALKDCENKDVPFALVTVGDSKIVVGYKGQHPAGTPLAIPDDVAEFCYYSAGGSCTNVTVVTGGAGLKGELNLSSFEKAKTIDITGEPSTVYFGSGDAETVSVPKAKDWQAFDDEDAYGVFSGYTNLVSATLPLPYDSWSEGYWVRSFEFMGCDKLQTVNWIAPKGKVLTGFETGDFATGNEEFANEIQTLKYIGYRDDYSVDSWDYEYLDSFSLKAKLVSAPISLNDLTAFDPAVKTVYRGLLYNAKGEFVGTFEATVNKASKTKDGAATVKITPVGAKKETLKGTVDKNGVGQGDLAGLVFGANGVVGKLVSKKTGTEYTAAGSDDITKSKDKEDKKFLKDLKKLAWGAYFAGTDVAEPEPEIEVNAGFGTFSFVMQGSGKAKVTGLMANGTKVSATTPIIAGADKFAIPVVYSKSKESFGFVLWVNDKKKASVDGITDWTGKAGKVVFVQEMGGAAGNALTPVVDTTFMVRLSTLPKVFADANADLLPHYEPFELKNGKADKWTFAKAPKVKFDKENKLDVAALNADIEKGKTNVSGLKLKLTKKSGEIKGEFNMYLPDKKGKIKKNKVTLNGVMLNGIGYVNGLLKKVGSFPAFVGNPERAVTDEQ